MFGTSIGAIASSNRQINKTFDPLSLSPMMMLDADNPAGNGTTPSDNSSLTTWVDLSGNGNDFIEGVAPTYKTSQMNGHNIVRFNGTTQYLTTPNNVSNSYPGATDITIFVIASLNNSPTTNNTILTKGNFPSGGWGIGLQGNNNHMEFTCFTVVQYQSTNIWTETNTYDLMTLVYTNGVGATIYKNGANADAIANAGSGAECADDMFLGLYSGGPYYWNGDINFIFVKYGLLTDDQVIKMNQYCLRKMGI